jgi:phosphatidylserine/phosphatidylglycerophosphate/cardiolipin synthase-like enzyme
MTPSSTSSTPSASIAFLNNAIRKGVITAESAAGIVSAGKSAAPELSDVECDWDSLKVSFDKKQELSEQQIDQVENFTQLAKKERHKVKDDEGSPVLQKLDLYLTRVEKLQESYKEAASKAAVAAIAGASFGPLATVAAYLAWNPASKAHVKEVTTTIEKLVDGTSPLVTTNNQVESVPQEKLWQAMLTKLDWACEEAKAGRPVPIDAQYFEMTSASFVGRLAKAAEAGCPVRVNIDPSRPISPSATEMTVDDGPRKMRALLQLAQLKKANVAISIFPVHEKLGSNEALMHRKLLRIGDTVLLGGMNANEGSGENFDTGYLIKGEAAQKLVTGFQQDLKTSTGVGMPEVYGKDSVENFLDKDVLLTPHGLATTFDALTGPSPAGTRIAPQPTFDELQQGAARLNLDLSDLVDVSMEDWEKSLKRGSTKPVELTEKGKSVLGQLIKKVYAAIAEPENQTSLGDVTPVEVSSGGATTVTVGSEGSEREAMILQSIATAEKFLYAPTFVITKAIARAIVARRDELKDQGKELDVKVVADAGVYAYGGTPNEDGVFALEDAGIPVHWSLLTRAAGKHDRKIHAKQILTDKMELIGSTNLSNKGIRENWELSGLIHFDPTSAAAQQDSINRFQGLWDHESVKFDSRAAAEKSLPAEITGEERETALEHARHKALQSFLGMVQGYEMQSEKLVQQILEDPAAKAMAEKLQNEGMAFGYSRLIACENTIGKDAFHYQLAHLPSRVKMDSANDN